MTTEVIRPSGRKGSVTTNRIPREEIFRLRNEGRRERIVEQLDNLDEGHDTESGVSTWQLRPGTVVMYKPVRVRQDGSREYAPRTVSVTAIGQLLDAGWSEICPACQAEHLDAAGHPTSDPNACKGMDALAVRICPDCGKRIYDNWGVSSRPHGDEADPNVIADEGAQTTPAQRTRVSLDLHMWARHPRSAQMRGLAPLPSALRDVVSGMKPV